MEAKDISISSIEENDPPNASGFKRLLEIFIGDGRLSYRPERILEAYYAFRAFEGLFFSLDYQGIANPAYNADRGPLSVFSCRLHAEY